MLSSLGINMGLPMDDTGKNILHENKLSDGLSSVSIEKDVDDWFIQSFGKEVNNVFKKNWIVGLISVISGGVVGATCYTVATVKTRSEYNDITEGIAAEYAATNAKTIDENYTKEFYSERYKAIGLARWFSDNNIHYDYTKYQLKVSTKDVYCDTLCTLSYEMAKQRFESRLVNSTTVVSNSRVSELVCSSFRNYFNFCMHKENSHDARLSIGNFGARPGNTGENIYNIYARICGETTENNNYKYTSIQDTHSDSDTINSVVYKYYTKDKFKSMIDAVLSEGKNNNDYIQKDYDYLKTIYETQLEKFFSGDGSNFDLAKLLANTYGYSNVGYKTINTLSNILKYDLLIDKNNVLKNFGTTPAYTVLDALLEHINNTVALNMSVIMNLDNLSDIITKILNAIYEYKYPISGTLEELILPIIKLTVISYINFLDTKNTSKIFTDIEIPDSIVKIYEIMFYIRHIFLVNQTVISAMNKNEYVMRLNGTNSNRLSNANPSIQSIDSYISKFKAGYYTRRYLTTNGLHTYNIATMKEI